MNKYQIISDIEPNSPITESFRSIRTNIDFLRIDEDIKVINVTSTGASEGKTTTIVNLATVLAHDNKTVLLIDLDLRKPKIHRYFELLNDVGVTDILLNKVEVHQAIKATNQGLHVLTAGGRTRFPSETLSSNKFEDLIMELKQLYDYVLLDAPPLGVVTDAAIMTRCTDGTLLVVQSGKTNKHHLKNVKRHLDQLNARIIGVVLNKVPKSYTDFLGYQYYSYYGRDD